MQTPLAPQQYVILRTGYLFPHLSYSNFYIEYTPPISLKRHNKGEFIKHHKDIIKIQLYAK